MDSGNQGPLDPALAQAKIDELQKALKDSTTDRAALEAQLGLLLKGFKTEALRVVEEILKYDPSTANADKQRLFAAYKNRILNHGGFCDRQLPIILGDFIVQQVFERKTETRYVNTRFKHPRERIKQE